tara:strand:+ start:10079 stop:11806 length:1728 start_codon:yes stop_codon:yes gene_type:complete
MFEHLFENRNKTVTNLIKLSDCLGRSLRENVELFAIDSDKEEVAFLSESGKVITGNYNLDENITLDSIKVQNVDVFSDNDVFDSYVSDKVSTFVGNLNVDDYSEADNSFSDILSLWENRLKFENVKKKLEEKISVFSESQNIINTDPFKRFLEVMPQVLSFLEEEKESIANVKEIENAVKLSSSVSKSFNFPKIELDALQEGPYTITKGINESIYEMLCKQELVKKELLESKKNFEEVWATNSKIRSLASLIYEQSSEVVLESLVEAIVEVPYLALSTKKQLFESLDNALGLSDYSTLSSKEIKEYSSKLFEMKKPIKKVVISLLNEKYGINVLNLKDTATFSSLANTQTVIFESLSRLAPKGSVLRETFNELGKMLKSKNGVEVIDVNDILQEAFQSCGYEQFHDEFILAEGLSFETLLEDELTISQLLEKVQKEKLLLDKNKKKNGSSPEDQLDQDNLSPEAQAAKDDAEKQESDPANDTEEEDDSVQAAQKNQSKKKSTKEMAVKEELDGEEGDTPEQESESEETEEEAPLSKEEFLDALKDLDELMLGLDSKQEDELDKEAESDLEDEAEV